jgi:hypothetical protein
MQSNAKLSAVVTVDLEPHFAKKPGVERSKLDENK